MRSLLLERKSSWVKRIGGSVALWATICGVGLIAGMSPRPLLLAGMVAALSAAAWLTTDGIGHAQAADWHANDEVPSRPRGRDTRVGRLESEIASSPTSTSSRLLLHDLLTDLADERLLSLRGIDRRSDPTRARAALGPEVDDFIASPDPGGTAVPESRMSLILNRIESL